MKLNLLNSIWRVKLLLLCGIGLISPLAQGIIMRHENLNEFSDVDEYVSNDLSEEVNGRFEFLMPNVRPYRPELYLCTPIKVDVSTTYYITGYEPNGTMNTAHHMLLYGCGKPGSSNSVWNCGEMAKTTDEKTAPPCDGSSHSQIIYAWARDAPSLILPEGVGFKVGRDSTIKYMVLQVHYAHVDNFKHGLTDNSGVFLHYTRQPLNKLAGVLLMGTAGEIPPMSTTHMETVCTINERKELHPIAYRTHTHSLGKVVSGYKVRTDDRGLDEWTLLGKRDPLTPQMFYPILNNETIVYGDAVAARCTMQSNRKRVTEVGPTAEDEMCNFYLMYYVENDEPLTTKYCFSSGPPKFYWDLPQNNLNNIPHIEASTL